jgi:hypothetical protein
MWGQGHVCAFPEDAEHSVWVPFSFSSLIEPLVLKMRRLKLEDSPLGRELLKLTPQPIGWQPRKRLLARQTQNSEPPTWDQIKKLMDIVMTVTGSLGIAGNPTATLLVALVIITI